MDATAKAAGAATHPVDLEIIRATGLHDFEPGKWCVWRAGEINSETGKFKKFPSNGLQSLSTAEPGKWLRFDEAAAIYERARFDGIGLLMGSVQGLIGIDLDNVLNDGGEVVAEKTELVADFEKMTSYRERSPSGHGLRAFVWAEMPRGYVANNGAGVEVYDGSQPRFLTVTGKCWPEGSQAMPIPERQTELELFLRKWGKSANKAIKADQVEFEFPIKARNDDEVLGLLLSERFDPEQRYLSSFAGEGDGKSEERFALLKQLGYITRDDEQIERLVRESKLNPEKFDERRSGYRNRLHYEITRALADQTRNYDNDIARHRQAESDQAGELAEKAGKVLRGDSAIAAEVAGVGEGGTAKSSDGKASARCGGGGGKRQKRLKADAATISELLINDTRLLGVLWFDEFRGMPTKSIPLSQAFNDLCAPKTAGQLEDDDVLALSAWIKREWELSCDNPQTLKGALRRWARAVSINPVAEKLQQFADEWDRIPRVNSWLTDYLGADDGDDEKRRYYLSEVGKRFLVAVVARALKPGTQQDQMLILENLNGGEGKSAAVRILARAIGEDTHLEGFSPSGDRDTVMLLRGKVLAEWGELSGFDKRESEWVKNFLTRCEDTYRDPFGLFNQRWPRTVSFIATTNQDGYVRELEGRRRYWPVRVGRIDLEALKRDAAQLWGEAVSLYHGGERFWVDPASPADACFRAVCDAEQRGRLASNAYDDMALDLANKLVMNKVVLRELDMTAPIAWTFTVQQMQRLLFPSIDTTVAGREWGAVTAAMKRTGWESAKMPGGARGWRLGSFKAAELIRLNNLPEPEALTPKVERGLRAAIKAAQAAGAAA